MPALAGRRWRSALGEPFEMEGAALDVAALLRALPVGVLVG